jgi:hypothetical protein
MKFPIAILLLDARKKPRTKARLAEGGDIRMGSIGVSGLLPGSTRTRGES